MTGNTVDGRKGQKSLLRTLIIVAMVLAFVFLISSNAFGEVRSIFSTQEDQSERVLEGVNIQLIKSQCKNNRDNYCSGDVPPQCPDELSESQKWACRKKTGLGNEENPFYCYEIWASKGGGGIGGIPACTGGATSSEKSYSTDERGFASADDSQSSQEETSGEASGTEESSTKESSDEETSDGTSSTDDSSKKKSSGTDDETSDASSTDDSSEDNEKDEPKPTFDIAFVPIGYPEESQGSADIAKFKADSRGMQQAFRLSSPFTLCENPSKRIKGRFIDPYSQGASDKCDIDQKCLKQWSGIRNAYGSCFRQIKECATRELGRENWDVVVGLCNNERKNQNDNRGMCDKVISDKAEELKREGYSEDEVSYITYIAGISQSTPSEAVLVLNPVLVGRGLQATFSTSIHELGHALGLYHINVDEREKEKGRSVCSRVPAESMGACQGPNRGDCERPLSEAKEFHMGYCDPTFTYGPAASGYLKYSALNKYLEGCFDQEKTESKIDNIVESADTKSDCRSACREEFGEGKPYLESRCIDRCFEK